MKHPIALSVNLNGETVGRLALTPENLCAFQYDDAYLQKKGPSISPFYLPLRPNVFVARRDPFNGNFGVFNDSLPDGWGNLLLDRFLRSKNINPANLSVLDRLSLAGSGGMGALEYVPDQSFHVANDKFDLNYLASEAHKILNQKEGVDSLDLLFQLGGSSGGARPKVLVMVDGKEWLIKFRLSQDPENVGQIEYQYSQLARDCGIEMPETRLFEVKYFGVKRFDREANKKYHVISAAGLLHADYRIPSLDYQGLLTACFKLTGDIREVYKLFRQMVFNVLIRNRDDHAKNISFILKEGKWKLSPAYDLLPGNGFNGFHTTTVAGNGNPVYDDIKRVAESLGLNRQISQAIYEELEDKISSFKIV
jgi:serine/threonine-protein kinase HipA